MLNKHLKQFVNDVNEGLSQTPKTLPSKYFYDERGDALFVKIMGMPEYYLSRAEMEIFSEKSADIIKTLQLDKSELFELIELGAGDGTKTQHLLKELSDEGYQYDYIPIDISKNSLDLLEKRFSQELPQVSCKPKHGDYFDILDTFKDSHHPKVVLFLGSNIGNMNDKTASEFIYNLGKSLSANDKLFIGADLIKSEEIIKPAYDDKQGITARFNLNLLHRINRELNTNFKVSKFEHLCEYTEEEGIAKSYLVSVDDQDIKVDANGKNYHFTKGERIHTEISRKYNDDIINSILSKTDFEIIGKISDSENFFSDYIFNKRK
ncbi:MAG: L-histidine N-alpha-methyltransferase [Cocleimonas sp.]